MKRARHSQSEKGAIDLIEEAVHLLRKAPLWVGGIYLLGAAPFLLGFLYYWADMSRSAYAYQHLAAGALGLSGLFVWMKFCQSIFARQMKALLTGEPAPTFTVGQYCRILLAQAAIQPSGLFFLPIALVITVPFGWVYAFYQNICVLAGGDSHSLRKSWSEAKGQAVLWPKQNHVLLAILAGFTFLVALNWGILGVALPHLLKMLFGIESVFTRGGSASILNSTFFIVILALTYLSVDPIIKCVYTLRCFYGEARRSGEDLKVDLKRFSLLAGQTAIFALLALLLTAAPAVAAKSAPSPTTASVAPVDLDRAVQQTLQQRKYAWRLPRQKAEEAPDGLFARFLHRIADLLRSWWKTIRDWIDWLRRHLFPRKEQDLTQSSSGYGWMVALHALLYVLVAVVVALLAVLVYRAIRDRRRKEAPVATQPIAPAPDLADENVGAELLPEDGWTKLGRELWQRGELRLALRAFYLASLAHLGERNFLTLARFKSNRDYERELRRRAHSFPAILNLFTENVVTFDRVWYGRHEIDQDLVARFLAQVEALKTGVQ